ncbi:hypothetical protein [Pseudomonas sp. S2_A02]
MAGGGYRGILAAVPLRNACVRPLGKGQQIKSQSNGNGNGNGNGKINSFASRLATLIVPTLRVGMPPGTLCVPLSMQGVSPAQW